jgi:hypothetical protein
VSLRLRVMKMMMMMKGEEMAEILCALEQETMTMKRMMRGEGVTGEEETLQPQDEQRFYIQRLQSMKTLLQNDGGKKKKSRIGESEGEREGEVLI